MVVDDDPNQISTVKYVLESSYKQYKVISANRYLYEITPKYGYSRDWDFYDGELILFHDLTNNNYLLESVSLGSGSPDIEEVGDEIISELITCASKSCPQTMYIDCCFNFKIHCSFSTGSVNLDSFDFLQRRIDQKCVKIMCALCGNSPFDNNPLCYYIFD